MSNRESERSDRVCAVIVTYHSGREAAAALLDVIAAQVEAVVVVDNGSEEVEVEGLVELATRFANVTVVPLDDNVGLGGAHNVGIRWADSRGFGFVLLLDDDSLPDQAMVAELLAAHAKLRDEGSEVAAVGPLLIDRRSGHEAAFRRFGLLRFSRHPCTCADDLIAADFLISSGALLPRAAWEQIGMMNEELFIDHVDTEWCLRARKRGWKIYGVCKARMQHDLGDATMKAWLGRWHHIPVHSPLRHYYTARNSVFMQAYGRHPLTWILPDLKRLIGMFFVFSTVPENRMQHASMMVRGIRDGIRGRLGPYSET